MPVQGRFRANLGRGTHQFNAQIHPVRPAPLISWFLPGGYPMREGAARNVASGRPDFLGSHSESSAFHGRSEVPTNTGFFAVRRLPCLDPSRSPARHPASSGPSTATRPASTGHHDPQLRPRSDRDLAARPPAPLCAQRQALSKHVSPKRPSCSSACPNRGGKDTSAHGPRSSMALPTRSNRSRSRCVCFRRPRPSAGWRRR